METVIETNTHSRSNPFPGLRPFKYDEAHLYFGRETQVGDVLDKLTDNHFVAIVGASGIGKSSFMYCGIFPTLKANIDTDLGTKWEIFSFTPGESPITNLAKSLVQDPNETKTESDIESILREKKTGLTEIIQGKYEREAKNYLVFIDQFEELFRFKDMNEENEYETNHFISTFLEAKTQRDTPVFVVLTMRSEFIGDCSQYPVLTNAVNDSQFLIPHMTRDEKRDAIVGPAGVMGAKLEDNLVEKILDDIGEKQDQLPIMQHALMRTWDNWRKISSIRGENISISDYNSIGGVKEALSNHADEVYAELNEQEKEICEKIFRVITEKGSTGREVRSPNTMTNIANITGYSIPEIAKVVNRFRREDTGLLMPPAHEEITEESKIDISHESLMRIWGMLKIWVEKETESAKRYIGIAEKAELYQKGETSFLVPPELTLATAWQDEQKPTKSWALMYHPTFERTMLFLEESETAYIQAEEYKENKRKRTLAFNRRIAIGASIGLLIAAFLAIFAIQKSSEAQAQTAIALDKEKEANKQKKKANKQKKKANKASKIAKKKEAEALLAKEKALKSEEKALEQKRAALVAKQKAAEAATIAATEAERAKIAQGISEIDARMAEIEKQKALIATEKARIAKQEADNLKMLSISKSMALKSVDLPDTTQAMVAQQAMKFYEEFGEANDPNDPDIYKGLYYAIKSQKEKEKNKNYNKLVGHTSNVRGMTASTFTDVVYTTSSDGSIQKWNIGGKKWYNLGGNMTPQPVGINSERVNKSLALSKNSRYIAVSGDYSYIQLYENEGNLKRLEIPDANQIWYLAFNASSTGLISADNRGKILYWDLSSQTSKELKSTHNSKITAIASHPIQNKIIVSRAGGILTTIDLATGNETNLGSSGQVVSLAFDNTGSKLITGEAGGLGKIWNFYGNSISQNSILRGHKARINYIAVSPTNNQLATASFDGTVRIWDLNNPEKPPIKLDDHKDWVWSISFNQDGSKLLAGCKDNVIRVWPTQIDYMSKLLCNYIKRDMNKKEWGRYVGKDVNRLAPCN